MAGHFSCIGFSFASRQEFGKIMGELFGSAEKQALDSDMGRSFVWTDGSAEVWFHPEANWCIVPGFTATTKISVTPREWIEDDSGCPYCAILSVDVLGQGRETLYPLAITFGDV